MNDLHTYLLYYLTILLIDSCFCALNPSSKHGFYFSMGMHQIEKCYNPSKKCIRFNNLKKLFQRHARINILLNQKSEYHLFYNYKQCN